LADFPFFQDFRAYQPKQLIGFGRLALSAFLLVHSREDALEVGFGSSEHHRFSFQSSLLGRR
jgi:hypothetical protein